MRNKKLGNDFEAEFCDTLFEAGYWAHNLAQNASGQPADVIAVKNGKAHLIDCKVCSNGTFALSRIEENQHLAMSLWLQSGNTGAWFALKLGEEIFLIPYLVLKEIGKRSSSLSENDIREISIPLKRWVKR